MKISKYFKLVLVQITAIHVVGFAPSSHKIISHKRDRIGIMYAQSESNSGLRTLKEITLSAGRALTSAAIACTIITSSIDVSNAADYTSFTDEQKAVAEAWRIVDNNFLDRTFNNQDWFKIRQEAVKKKYKSMDEANKEIDKIVGSLGDKYTRYLPPAKYKSMVDSATGTLAGVGVEIGINKENGKVYVADVEPSSPASSGE